MNEPPIIEIQDLCKEYITHERTGLFRLRRRVVHALRGVSLEIAPGEIVGILGPNGAGKTTLIKCLTTLLIPTSGVMRICGHMLGAGHDAEVRAAIGCMLLGERGLYWKLTGRENLTYFATLYRVPSARRAARVNELLALLRLGEIADRAVETYSSGQRMKLAFAKALVHDAPVLILDEPTVSLDLPTARELRAIVRELNAAGRTVLYTTHQMAEAEEMCHRVAIMDRGEIIALGTVGELKGALHQQGTIRVRGVIPAATVAAARALDGVQESALIARDGTTELAAVTVEPRLVLPHLVRVLVQHGATIESISPGDVTLEDVFLAKTGRSLQEDTRQR